jgi:hypothetical protein
VVRVYHGTGDEYAQFRGTGTDGYRTDVSANLRVIFRGTSDVLQLRLARTGWRLVD